MLTNCNVFNPIYIPKWMTDNSLHVSTCWWTRQFISCQHWLIYMAPNCRSQRLIVARIKISFLLITTILSQPLDQNPRYCGKLIHISDLKQCTNHQATTTIKLVSITRRKSGQISILWVTQVDYRTSSQRKVKKLTLLSEYHWGWNQKAEPFSRFILFTQANDRNIHELN